LNDDIYSFDIENINKLIKEETVGIDELAIELGLSKVPDIYCILLKDRERESKIKK
jgi:hypothetical protein